MGYIANSVFSAGGVKYRPGENVPAIENAQKFLELGFIISDGIIEAESEAPKSEGTEQGLNGGNPAENGEDNPTENGEDNAQNPADNGENKPKKAAKK